MEPRDVVLAYYTAVDAADLPRLLGLFHPQAEYRRGGYPPLCGANELRHFYADVRIIASGRHTIAAAITDGHDRDTGLRGIIAVHDSSLGPGWAGVRMRPYATHADASPTCSGSPRR